MPKIIFPEKNGKTEKISILGKNEENRLFRFSEANCGYEIKYPENAKIGDILLIKMTKHEFMKLHVIVGTQNKTIQNDRKPIIFDSKNDGLSNLTLKYPQTL